MWNVENIGETAGLVWDFLHAKGRSSLNAVERGINPDPTIKLRK
jgi:hypothetical protein